MTKITIPARTPEHAATETALHVALKRIEVLERAMGHAMMAVFFGGIIVGLICGAILAAVGVAT